ncbi:uncharacterized protein LOC131282729 [Anopheles ziemanni]|uniref:uncharacterized protein LOC131263230 n=1 Tax=Anopheles coustani TaxID=139045 RepID=UPI00265AA4CE|nr:uncharacterized protein LOC131263230 [Anopheles coustani]XP_058168250.1 uncharacterized protein LOC131282729 [Anopheles ziemanni]
MASLLTTSRHVALFRQQQIPNVWILTWLIGNQRKSTNINAIDSFISELVENKSLKWKVLNSRHRNGQPRVVPSSTSAPIKEETIKRVPFRLTELYTELTQNPLVVNISKLDVAQLDQLVATALKEQNKEDVSLLINQMLQFSKIPSLPVLHTVFKYLSDERDKETLEQLIDLCVKLQIKDGKDCRFDHYRALCQWKFGNTFKSLESFREIIAVSDEDQLIAVDHMLREMIDETIGKKSEAVLLAVMGLCEYCITEVKHEFPICYVWEKSFHSSWHSDQQAAKTIFDRHEPLRKAISKRLGHLSYKMLYDNDVEKVYQLIEMFLKHNMKAECKSLLIRLFEYQYWRKNLRGCSEIMQNAIDLNITLPEMYNRHLLELLLGRGSKDSFEDELPKKTKELKPNKYELKF